MKMALYDPFKNNERSLLKAKPGNEVEDNGFLFFWRGLYALFRHG